MKETRIIFCSDVHLCHLEWYGRSSADRMGNMIDDLNKFYDEKPYEKVIFLGDYSLDHWGWSSGGSWLNDGVCNTENFIKHYAHYLKAPYYLAPGNHEQYGFEKWQEITGTPRDDSFVIGGYLFISCDNYAGELDPDHHSDGIYTLTKLDYIKEKMEEYPDLPVILCGHYFNIEKEPEEFFTFLKEEKRITLLVCGHDHGNEITDLGERAGHVCVYHTGHYSYAGLKKKPMELMWGFCETLLTEKGVDIRYVEPENTFVYENKVVKHGYREQKHAFFRRRDRDLKMISAGHICLDITPTFPDKSVDAIGDILIPGRLLPMGEADVHTGGSVANTGLALKILGADVSLMGKIGKDAFGELVYSQVKEYGAHEGMIVSEDANTSYSVVVAPKGIDRIFLHHTGANDKFYKKDLDFPLIEKAQLFHLGYPTLMRSMYENDGQELLDIMQEVKRLGVLTSMDMAAVEEYSEAGQKDWDGILKKVLPYVDFFVPSVEELAFMIDRERFNEWQKRANGKDITTVLDVEQDIRPLGEKLIQYGVKVALIKCGAPGIYLATAEQEKLESLHGVLAGGIESWANVRVFEKSYKPDKILSGTGAGDTSIAAFLYAILTGHTYQECLQLATATGASCVAAYDALSGLKSFDELKAKIKNGWEKN